MGSNSARRSYVSDSGCPVVCKASLSSGLPVKKRVVLKQEEIMVMGLEQGNDQSVGDV